ncbi:beta-carotene 15,15'-monooxygenase [Corynebacterium pelargi]|uniref:Uncharacterized protein n=1 Tax=Corynebacterium pelargi TaxID=1471400 RepID=A0A410W9G0_9CORY|nr:beta-carotene 15,15'-monooxygenase [Corynebacterium pelargi]QAU52593.1 hypothetical protein CPELA_06650 [Corynebacterium pelargi]GGG77524.1 hypothetical protein GCM10007338_14230 [Corynebacterium pelargi]
MQLQPPEPTKPQPLGALAGLSPASAKPTLALSDHSLATRARWHTSLFVIIAAWVLSAIAAWVARFLGQPVSWWQAIHTVTLGAIATAIFGYITHFTEALTRQPPSGFRAIATRIGLLQLGLILLMVSSPASSWHLLETLGASLITLASLWQLWWVITRLRGSLSGRFASTVPMYIAALVALCIAIGCVVCAGFGLGSFSGLIAAHARAALWGFVGFSMYGTVVTLLPTLSATPISEEARARVSPALFLLSLCLLHIVWLLIFQLPRIAGVFGLGLCAVGAWLLWPIVRSAVRHSSGLDAAPAGVVVALCSLLALQLFDATALILGRDPREVFQQIIPALLASVLLLVVLSVLQFLLPTMVGGGPKAVQRARARAQRSGYARIALIIVGSLLALFQSPLWIVLVGLGVLWTVLALSFAVVRQRKGLRHG